MRKFYIGENGEYERRAIYEGRREIEAKEGLTTSVILRQHQLLMEIVG